MTTGHSKERERRYDKKMKQIRKGIISLLLAFAMLCTLPGATALAQETDVLASQAEGEADSDELKAARTAAHEELRTYAEEVKSKILSDLLAVEEVNLLLGQGDVAIDKAQSADEVQSALAEYKHKISPYKPNREIEELREWYIYEVYEYKKNFNKEDYTVANWNNLDVVASWAKRDMNAATTEAKLKSILEQTKKDMDAYPKIVPGENDWFEQEMNERAQLIKDVIAELKKVYDARIDTFTEVQKKDLKQLLDKGSADLERMINNVPTDSVGGGVDRKTFEFELDRRFKIAKYNLEERMNQYDYWNIGLAKTDAIRELKAYKDAKNYRTAQKKELEAAIEAGRSAIRKETTKEGIARALKDAKAKLDKIKTSAQLKKEEAVNTPAKTAISGKVKAQKKSFTVKWKKQTKNVDGYEVCYSTSSKFPKKGTVIKKVGKKTTTKLTVKRLKSKKKYYVKVRTYKTVSGKKYVSDWSSVKTVLTKK